jgi:hypothetical protein
MDTDEDAQEDQEVLVRMDIRHLTQVLTPDNLRPDVMFAKKRGIRSCAPDLANGSEEGQGVADRLRRVPPPEPQE